MAHTHTDNITLRDFYIFVCQTLEVAIPFNPPRAQFVLRHTLQNVINVLGVLVEHLIERYRAEDLIVDGRIILKWFLKKWDGEAQTALI
jgi:predicted RNA-binding protein with PUA domain